MPFFNPGQNTVTDERVLQTDATVLNITAATSMIWSFGRMILYDAYDIGSHKRVTVLKMYG